MRIFMYSLLACLIMADLLPAANAAEFTLFYSNDIRGETEPCG